MKRIILLIGYWLLGTGLHAQSGREYTSANVKVFQSPDASGKIIAIIPRGTVVLTSENAQAGPKWELVYYNGVAGYVYKAYLHPYRQQQEIYHPSIHPKPKGSVHYYTNSEGERVQSPTYYDSPPEGATAVCRDGTYSFSRNHRGTCSHHGGVAKWLN